MQAVLTLLVLPILALNAFGGIVSVVWLLVLGQWRPVVTGLLAMPTMYFLIPILMLPNLVFIKSGNYFAERENGIMAVLFLFCGSIYTTLLMIAWAFVVFVSTPLYLTSSDRIPLLVWSYTVATGVWAYLARKDGGDASFGSALFLQIAYLVAIGMTVFRRSTFEQVAVAFLVLMAVPLVLNLVIGTTSAVAQIAGRSR